MRVPHKHADIIKAWADGAEIEFFAPHSQEWRPLGNNPQWFESIRFRIKPEPKPDVVVWCGTSIFNVRQTSFRKLNDNLKLIFDGETGKLKSAEVL